MKSTKFILSVGLTIGLVAAFAGLGHPPNIALLDEGGAWNAETKLYDVLRAFGEEKAKHDVNASKAEMQQLVTQGFELIHYGQTTDAKGNKTSKQSIYYVCTSCHNTDREDPDLNQLGDAQARLEYVAAQEMPFLQGTTFYGTVNKDSWYNGDYYQKYGDLVKPAEHDLTEAIQLCATVCSQGRAFEDWEMKAVLAYFWTLSYTLGDLGLNAEEIAKLNEYATEGAKTYETVISDLKSRYMRYTPATFADKPGDYKKGYGLTGDPDNGALIYEYSCQHCHRPNGESNFVLDDAKLTFKFLYRHMCSDNHFSIYNMVRDGTYSGPGHKSYMPLYPKEKMSDQQIEDLRAYITQSAGKKI